MTNDELLWSVIYKGSECVKKHGFCAENIKKKKKVFVNSKISINFAPFLKAKHVLLF